MFPVRLTEYEYRDHEDSYDGLCSSCGEWRYGDTEPDADYYPCTSCGNNKVVGVLNAMIDGLIEIV